MTRSKTARRRTSHQPRPLPRIPDCTGSAEQPGMVNAYVCELQHVTSTVVLVFGTTSAFMPCPHTEPRGFPVVNVECGLRAASAWYRLPNGFSDDYPPTHEWYRPTDDERRLLDPHQASHINAGGLLLRPIAPVPA